MKKACIPHDWLKVFDKEVVLYALRLVVAATIAAAVGKMMNVGHLYWLMFTAVLVLQSESGSSLKRSAQRITGTIIGAPSALLLIAIVGYSSNVALFILLLLAVIMVFFYQTRNYMVAAAFITMAVLLGFPLMGIQHVSNVATVRVFDTLLGAGIALAVALLVLPIKASDHLKEDIAQFLRLSGNHFILLTQEFTTGQGKQLRADNQRTYLALGKTILQKLDETVWEGRFFPASNITGELKLALARNIMFLSNRYLEMTTLSEKSSHAEEAFCQSLADFSLQVDAAFTTLSKGAAATTPEALAINIASLKQTLESKVNAIPWQGENIEKNDLLWEDILREPRLIEF